MSFPRYERYKDSGVEWLGEVPEHWDVKKIKYVLTREGYKAGPFGSSLITSELSDEGDILVLTPEHVANESFDLPFNQYLKESRRNEMSAFFVDLNDVIFPIVGTLGRAMIVSVPRPGILNQRLARMSADITKLLPAYLKLILTDVDFYKKLDEIESKGAILNHITKEKLINRPILTPPIKEQKQILSFLGSETAKIDGLIAEQQQLIELLKEKRQAVISHAVTKGLNPDVPMKDSGVEWLGEVPEHWKHHLKLKDLAQSTRNSFVNGPFGSDLLTSELTQEGIPVIYIRDLRTTGYTRTSEWHISQEKAKQLNFCNVISGDILVAKVGDPPGLAVLYPVDKPEGIVTQDVIRIRVNEDIVDKCFLIYLLNSDYGHALIDNISVESTRKRISLGEYKQLPMILPPKEEQMKITSFLGLETAKLSILTDEAQRAIELFKERRTALISAAVTGKIDVRGVAA